MRKLSKFKFSALLLAFLLIIVGCHKDVEDKFDKNMINDFVDDNYFVKNNPSYNPKDKGISTENNEFLTDLTSYFLTNPKKVESLIKNYGYPIWAKAKYFKTDQGENLVVAFASINDSKVNYLLHINKNHEKINLKGIAKKDIHTFPKVKKDLTSYNFFETKEKDFLSIALLFMYFEDLSFQKVDCNLARVVKELNTVKNDIFELETRNCTIIEFNGINPFDPNGWWTITFIYCTALGPDYTSTAGTTSPGFCSNCPNPGTSPNGYTPPGAGSYTPPPSSSAPSCSNSNPNWFNTSTYDCEVIRGGTCQHYWNESDYPNISNNQRCCCSL